MKVVFIPGKKISEIPWGADFFLKATIKYSENEIIPHYGFNNLGVDCGDGIWEEADLIHIHNLSHTTLYRRPIFGWKSRIKEYVSFKGDRPIIVGGIRGFVGLKKGLMWVKYFDAIHVGCHELLEKIKTHNPMGFINYPGVDTDLFKPDYARPREFTVLWVGDTGKPVKNSKLLDLLDWHVKMASKENYISHDEMPNFYNSGHVLINLSNKEGFCRPVIEAMACGLPVISTRTGIAPLILDEYFLIDNPRTREGWVQLNDKLRYLSQNPLEREWTGKQNRQKAMMFSWKNSISRLDLMWDSLKRTRKINEERYVLPLDQMTDHIIARAQ